MDAGIEYVAVISGRGKRAVEDHFDISYELEHQIAGTSKDQLLDNIRLVLSKCSFTYTRQMEMKGLGHAVLTGKPIIGNEPFAMILADDFCVNEAQGVLSQMVELYKTYQCSIVAIEEVPSDATESYGIIAGDEIEPGVYRVTNMVEKPKPEDAPSNLAIIGRYILTPDIFDKIENTPPGRNGEIQITDALAQQAAEGNVIAYKFKGQRFDCGSIAGFVEATNYVYNNYYTKGWNYPVQKKR